MKKSLTRSKYAQNRIAYIVYGNPDGARKFLFDQGYHPPKNIHDLVKATKELVKNQGKSIVPHLLTIHPEKDLILKLNQPESNQKEDSFCGACGSSSFNPESNFCGAFGNSNFGGDSNLDVGDYIDQLVDMTTSQLEKHYQEVLAASNKKPEDLSLMEEVQLVWNELRQRKLSAESPTKEEPKGKDRFSVSKDGLVILGLTLVAGVLIGSSIKSK